MRCSNIEISEIPHTVKNNKLEEISIKILTNLDVLCDRKDIEDHRLELNIGRKEETEKRKEQIVRFVNRSNCEHAFRT